MLGALFPVQTYAQSCGSLNGDKAKLFGMKSWYYYLDCSSEKDIDQAQFSGDKLVPAVWKIVLTVLNDLFFLSGFLAVILIIYAGFNYITSAGDSGKAARATKMLTGTIVGLIIVVLAQVIVNTILGMMSSGGGA